MSLNSNGFSLIEVMIAVFVLAIGLLGIAGLQTTGIKSNHTAYIHTQATQLAYDLADRMRANIPGTEAGNYLASTTLTPPYVAAVTYNCFDDFTGTTTAGTCSPDEMALADLDWVFSLATNTLPIVSMAIKCTSPMGIDVVADTIAKDCPQGFKHTITVTWNEHDVSNSGTGFIQKSITIDIQP